MASKSDGSLLLKDVTKATRLPKALATKLFKHFDGGGNGHVDFPAFVDVVGRGGPPAEKVWWKPVLEALGEKIVVEPIAAPSSSPSGGSRSPSAPTRRKSVSKQRRGSSKHGASGDVPSPPAAAPDLSLSPVGASNTKLKSSEKLRQSSKKLATAPSKHADRLTSPDAKSRSLPSLGKNAPSPTESPSPKRKNLPSLKRDE